ncbi:hypothetical protein J6590_084368 [Homalodisca vitripennis]|nr:hypothetical protein J6590_084368 [Homalodisca vitripennis]
MCAAPKAVLCDELVIVHSKQEAQGNFVLVTGITVHSGRVNLGDPMIEEYTQAQHLEKRRGCSLPGSPLKLGRVKHSIPQMSLMYNRCQEFALNEFVAEVVGPLQTHIDSKFQA